MATFDDPQLLDALSAPLGDLISSVGTSVAEAQRALDQSAIESLQQLYESDANYLLQSIGYRPTWYQIPQVDAEIAVALTVTGQTEETRQSSTAALPESPAGGRAGKRVKMYAAPMDAGYTSRYGFELQAASKVSFKIVPVPPSSPAEAMQAVPPLVGRTLRQALALLRTLNIDYARPDPADLEARVTLQSPGPGAILEPDELVTLELALAPDVTGLTVADARSLLAGEGLDLVLPADVAEYSIVATQDPAPFGALLGDSVAVDILRVPDLLRGTLGEARDALDALGLVLGDAPGADEALITTVTPAPGTPVSRGATVDLASAAPDLRLMSLHDAQTALAALGVQASAPAGADPTDVVATQAPAPGQPLLDGQLVALTVGVVPDVTGLRSADALDALRAIGLDPRAGNGPHPDVRVESQSPAAGAPTAPGLRVELTLFLVPEVRGLPLDKAQAELKARGMPWKVRSGARSASLVVADGAEVTGQAPAPGKRLSRSARHVRLTVSSGGF